MRVRAVMRPPAGALLFVVLLLGGQGVAAEGPEAGPLGGPCHEALPTAACAPSEQVSRSCRTLLSEDMCQRADSAIGQADPVIREVDGEAADAVRFLYGERRFTATDGTATDGFGRAVAIDGDRIVVGAPFEDDRRGAVYLFEPDDAGGHTEVRLTAPVREERARFGFAVAMDGDRIVVGAPGEHDERGAVYVFEPDGSGGQVAVRLVAAAPRAYSELGASVAVDGDRVAVGSPTFDLWPSRARGAVYLFTETTDGVWSQERVLASDGAGGDWFGFSVALDADRMVVGAPFADAYHGATYVYDGAPGGLRETKVTVPNSSPESYAGTSVAVAGDLLVVGTQGAVHVFDAGEMVWAHRVELNGEGSASSGFGESVAVDDSRIAVGAPVEDWRRGAVYVFEPDGDDGFTRTRIVASDAHRGSEFGMRVDLQGELVLAGSPGVDGAPAAAYLHDRASFWFGLL